MLLLSLEEADAVLAPHAALARRSTLSGALPGGPLMRSLASKPAPSTAAMSSAGVGGGARGGGGRAAEEEEEVKAAASAAEVGLAAVEEEMLTSALPSCADTVADATPGTFVSALSTAPEHEAQLIPLTSRRMISETPAARLTPATAARKPTPSTAAIRSEGFRTEASNVTSAASCKRATHAEWTPGRALLLDWMDGKRGRERKRCEFSGFRSSSPEKGKRRKHQNQIPNYLPERILHRRGARRAVHALDRELLRGWLVGGAEEREGSGFFFFPCSSPPIPLGPSPLPLPSPRRSEGPLSPSRAGREAPPTRPHRRSGPASSFGTSARPFRTVF